MMMLFPERTGPTIDSILVAMLWIGDEVYGRLFPNAVTKEVIRGSHCHWPTQRRRFCRQRRACYNHGQGSKFVIGYPPSSHPSDSVQNAQLWEANPVDHRYSRRLSGTGHSQFSFALSRRGIYKTAPQRTRNYRKMQSNGYETRAVFKFRHSHRIWSFYTWDSSYPHFQCNNMDRTYFWAGGYQRRYPIRQRNYHWSRGRQSQQTSSIQKPCFRQCWGSMGYTRVRILDFFLPSDTFKKIGAESSTCTPILVWTVLPLCEDQMIPILSRVSPCRGFVVWMDWIPTTMHTNSPFREVLRRQIFSLAPQMLLVGDFRFIGLMLTLHRRAGIHN